MLHRLEHPEARSMKLGRGMGKAALGKGIAVYCLASLALMACGGGASSSGSTAGGGSAGAGAGGSMTSAMSNTPTGGTGGATSTSTATAGSTSSQQPTIGGTCPQLGIANCQQLQGLPKVSIGIDQCEQCQGTACGGDAGRFCTTFPCVAGSTVIRGCCTDSDCSGLSPFCGHGAGPHGVCVMNDAL